MMKSTSSSRFRVTWHWSSRHHDDVSKLQFSSVMSKWMLLAAEDLATFICFKNAVLFNLPLSYALVPHSTLFLIIFSHHRQSLNSTILEKPVIFP